MTLLRWGAVGIAMLLSAIILWIVIACLSRELDR